MADPIQEVLNAFAHGELVVVTDDDDREGEGDLIVAASLCTIEKMAFIIRHTSGIVCAPITMEDARRLRLDPMVAHNESSHTTAFTVSIDYKPDGGTGISAEERASCCRALANPNVGANDFARPGHVFPLIARDGGVLLRSGHTEAAVDLCSHDVAFGGWVIEAAKQGGGQHFSGVLELGDLPVQRLEAPAVRTVAHEEEPRRSRHTGERFEENVLTLGA